MAPNSSHVPYTTSNKYINAIKQLDCISVNSASLLDSFKSIPSGLRIACVIDLDNLCSRRGQHGRSAWAHLDIVAFTAAIRKRGATIGTVFQNQRPGAYASTLWATAGLECVGTGTNVDERVKLAAVSYAIDGLHCLILVGSDGGYDEVIHTIRRCGIRVELWALRAAVARHLVYAADAVRWIDEFVHEPDLSGPSAGPTTTQTNIAA